MDDLPTQDIAKLLHKLLWYDIETKRVLLWWIGVIKRQIETKKEGCIDERVLYISTA